MSDLQTEHASEIQNILEQLNHPPGGELPEQAIRTVQARAGEFVPYLIDFIRQATEAAGHSETPADHGYFVALFLLAEFKAIEAWPAIRALLLLPDDDLFGLLGDFVTEDLPALLPAFAMEQTDILDELIANRDADLFVRWAATQAFAHLVRSGRLTREEVISRLRQFLRQAIQDREPEVCTPLAMELADYGATEALDDIREAFQRNLFDKSMTSLEELERVLAQPEASFQKHLERYPDTGVDDTVEALREFWSPKWFGGPILLPNNESGAADDYGFDNAQLNWASEPANSPETLRHDAAHVGRNDPCPCGSGKKFKKCCLRH